MNKFVAFSLIAGLLVFLSFQLPPTNASIHLLRHPYLQSAIADSVTILWRTDSGTQARVDWRNSATSEWTSTAGVTRITNTGLTENEVTLHGLAPGAQIHYRIFTDGQQLLADEALSFPAPIGPTDSVFSCFAVGDIGEPVETHGTPDQLGVALSHFVDSFQFGLLLGDIIYPDGKSEVYDQNLFQYFRKVFPYVPVFTVLGNHDWHEPEDNYMQEWNLPGNEHYYSFDHGNVHFIALDTKNGEMYDYDRQIAWLKNDLANRRKDMDWTIVFLHHNGKSCTYKNDYEGVVSLYPIFAENGVDLVLNGHAHTYERLNPMNGEGDVVSDPKTESVFTSITVGSGGKLRGIGSDPTPWTPAPDSCRYPGLVAASVHDWAFLALDIHGKRLTGRAIRTSDLKVVDEFERSKAYSSRETVPD